MVVRLYEWTHTVSILHARVCSKLKIKNSSTFQGPKLHLSSTKIIDRKPYPTRGHSNFRLQFDTEACKVKSNTVSKYWWHAYKCLLQNCQQMQNLNSFKHLICFQTLSRALKFLFQIQAFSRISQACYEPWHAFFSHQRQKLKTRFTSWL